MAGSPTDEENTVTYVSLWAAVPSERALQGGLREGLSYSSGPGKASPYPRSGVPR